MFDDDDGVATVYKFLQHIHQNADVLEMQTGGGLVENIERLTGITFRQFGGEFHALALAAAEGGGGLSQLDISQSHLLDGFDFTKNVGHILEEFHSLVDGHVEHVGNRLSLEAHLQRFTVVTLAVALLAGHLDVRQEIHFNRLVAIAPTRLTASAFNIEREAPRLITSYLGFGQIDKQRADVGENARVGGRIGTWCATDRTLIDIHHLIYIFQPLNTVVRHRLLQ